MQFYLNRQNPSSCCNLIEIFLPVELFFFAGEQICFKYQFYLDYLFKFVDLFARTHETQNQDAKLVGIILSCAVLDPTLNFLTSI